MQRSLLNVNGPVHISGGQFSIVNNNQVISPGPITGFNQLHAQIAVAALHNAFNSFESGQCHPNTREKVLKELLQFIQDKPNTRKNWILWLSGPAGSGKTTITRTLAHLCSENGFNQASFFFCRLDTTRNGIKPLVATLSYQIACRFPTVKDTIVAEIERRPHIFDLSVEEQFQSLIINPLRIEGWNQDLATTQSHTIVCVIDALDECGYECGHECFGLRSLEVQSYFVQTLHKLSSAKDCPVIFVLASRPEAHLRMSFNQIRNTTSRIYLDNSYDPSVDIRRFVVDTINQIRTVHPLAPSFPYDWPEPSVIDAIVAKSSGQFIYAATVMRQISSPLSDPVASLDALFNSLSTESPLIPFAELDSLFAFILGRAPDWPVISTILSCHLLALKLSDIGFSRLLEPCGLSVKSVQRYLLGITSLVEVDHSQERLVLHNESLADFLLDYRRSGRFYVDLSRASYDSLMKFLREGTSNNAQLVVDYIIALLPEINNPSEELQRELRKFYQETVMTNPGCLGDFGRHQLLDTLSNLDILDLSDGYSQWSLVEDADISPSEEWFQSRSSTPPPPLRRYFNSSGTTKYARSSRPLCLAASDSDDSSIATHSGLLSYPAHDADFDNDTLRPTPLIPGSPAWFQDELLGVDLHDIRHLLASILISDATGMLYGDVADIMGYDHDMCTRVFSSLPSLLEYNNERMTVTFHHGRKLLDYVSSPGSGVYYIKVREVAIQTVIRMLSSSNPSKEGLFGDLSALLAFIKIPTMELTRQLQKFAMVLPASLDLHVLDFTTFLDTLARMYGHNPYAYRSQDNINISPDYMVLLTQFAQFWGFSHSQLDPQLLNVPEFSRIWQQQVG